METHAPFAHVHPYMKKGHSIKVDVLSRQALVSPIFRKPQIPPISDRYVKVFDPLVNNLESRTDENYLIHTKLYDKYKSVFNNISRESLLNYSITKSEEVTREIPCSESSSSADDSTCTNTESAKSDYVESFDHNEFNKILDSKELISVPWVSIVPHLVKSMFKSIINEDAYMPTMSEHSLTDYTSSDDSLKISKIDVKTPEQTAEPELAGSPTDSIEINPSSVSSESSSKEFVVKEKCVRRLFSALATFVKELDYWNDLVTDSLARTGSNRLTLTEARVLVNDYRYITFGLLNSELSNRLENEIRLAEEYSSKVREKLAFIFDKESEESSSIDLSLAENLLKEGSLLTFATTEFISLSHLFYSVSSLRNLLDESILRSDISNSNILIEECDNSVIKIPDLENVKAHLSKIVWLNNAQKYSQKPVNYKLVGELIENTPDELRTHTLYQHLNNKLNKAFKLIERLKEPKYKYLMSSEDLRMNNQSKDKNHIDKESDSEDESIDEEELRLEDKNGIDRNKKLKPEELEDIHNNYQEINLIIPIYKAIEPAYLMWKRFQRRHKKVESLISSENTSNCTIECLVLLQQAETLKEYIDIHNLLEPIKADVENSLKFEKKCRNVLNRFNNWSITNDFIKFKTEWHALTNFRKNASVNKKDLEDLINLVNLYKTRETTVNPDNPNDSTVNNTLFEENEEEEIMIKPRIKRRRSTKRMKKLPSEDRSSDSLEEDEDRTQDKPTSSGSEVVRDKVGFQEIVDLFNEFWNLRVKNWQIFRNLQEIHNSCLEMIDKCDNIINDIKEGMRSDEIVSNLILITIETLKFGANLELDDKLLNSVKYCLWIKKLYSSMNKLHTFLTSDQVDINNFELESDTHENYHNASEFNPESDEMSSKSDESSKSEEMSISSEESNLESEDMEIEYENSHLRIFVTKFKSLVEEFDNDCMEEFVDSTHPISYYINITPEEFNNTDSIVDTTIHTNVYLERLLESQKIFTLTERDFLTMFTTTQQ
ncbi:hypothetical protein TpMuguga_01g00959 [Theileria parva strain Muguga]|uniref:Lysine-specific demethylase-like domain-containing protein n=1 Tax=Theileria parva TaxID=5875 RepID=Q4N761_THEPA|nr:uncharacterized protein TpMuguga_01g00959 [Theileria parva strain Muguga]EAN34197.1 hypothetical protein TpMuguga_01g00959 [Theileria parva strain Muguga]|eukprot:XP_766480.1 hypothetical protein [Theileria parva strain Muguga]